METNFEEKSKIYINELVNNNNDIIEISIIGVNEDYKTSTCVARILNGDLVEEKHILIYEQNEEMIWKLLKVIDETLIE
jgi:hypothetical protein